MNTNPCLREYARYAVLNITGMLALSCYILADTFFVANGMGADGLTALNLALPVYSLIHGSGLMLGIGGATRYSISRHQGSGLKSSAAFSHTLFMGGCLSAVFFLIGLFFSGDIAALLGADDTVFYMCRIYLQVMLLFAPAFMLDNILLSFVRNDGAPGLAMAAMTIGSLSNIVLDYLFIFPMGMGMLGAALATGLAPIISMTVLSPYFIQKRNGFRPVACKPDLPLGTAICAAGLPSLVNEISSGLVILIFNYIILGLNGNLGVAAYAVVANLSLVVFAVYTGIAQGAQPLFSRYYGAGARHSASAVLRYALLTIFGLSTLICLSTILGADAIAAAFSSEANAALVAMAAHGMRLYFLACPCVGLNILLAAYFTSTDTPRPAHLIAVLRGLVLIIPLSFLLAQLWGMTGLWLTLPLTEWLVAAGAVTFCLRYLRQNSRRQPSGQAQARPEQQDDP